MSNDPRNREESQNIQLSPAQQDPGRADPNDFKIIQGVIEADGSALHGQFDPALMAEAQREHPNHPIPERNAGAHRMISPRLPRRVAGRPHSP
jgi:hypothetical protein